MFDHELRSKLQGRFIYVIISIHQFYTLQISFSLFHDKTVFCEIYKQLFKTSSINQGKLDMKLFYRSFFFFLLLKMFVFVVCLFLTYFICV